MIAGEVLTIDGKDIQCPSAPLYVVKSWGYVVDIQPSHYEAEASFGAAVMGDKELWRLDVKGRWALVRRVRNGKEG